MAGAGYKLFTTGSVLTAADVNTYLNEQTVMVFNNATARTTALSGVLAEGMVSYLKDTNATEVYDGSAWVGIGNSGDITGITTGATSGLTGGVTSGTADLKFNTTAKGGLLVGTGSGTVTELTVGSNDTVLTADSSTASGLKWATPATGGAWTQAATGSLSGSSITVSSLSGKAYAIFFDGVSASGADVISRIRFNGDTGSNYYPVSQPYFPEQTGSSGTSLNIGGLLTAANTYFGFIYIPFAGDGQQGKMVFHEHNGVLGAWKSTAAITSINFTISSGTYDAGTYYIWSQS